MNAGLQIACAACGYAAELPGLDPDLPEVVQCPMCGTWIRDFKAEVEAASQPPPEPPSADADGAHGAALNACLIEAGSAKTLEDQYPLTGALTVVGREDSDINIEDPTMSIRHFEIEHRNGEFFIRDLESTNHTRVNGRQISSTTLHSGDRIQAGLTMLVFLAG